ncbi:MAG: secretion protein [Roseateles sp.]|uniref:secretion protein n=1 Tax=Roseateles sp. TaxID=1971397 RepID=UPI0040369356
MNNLNLALRPRKLVVAMAVALAMVCAAHAEAPARSFGEMLERVALVPAGEHDSEMLAKVSVAVGHLKRLDLPKAQAALNEALQLDPRSSHLHFLNGFVYHLQARLGDSQKSDLALEGYQQALRIDPGNWIAQEFLGLAHMELKQYDRAKRAFSEVLLLTPDSLMSINGLMVASYLTGDARTACAMAEQFHKRSAQPSAGFLRSSMAVYASCGNFAEAGLMRAALVQLGGDGAELTRIDRRVAQWKGFYSEQERKAASIVDVSLSRLPAETPPTVLAQAFTLPKLPAAAPGQTGQKAAPMSAAAPSPAAPAPEPLPATATSATAAAPTMAAAPGIETADSGPRMLLVDVVLLSTQELISTSKGINLLSALTLQLGSVAGNLPAYSRVVTSNTVGEAAAAVSTAITRAVTIPALTYSLNIANANNSFNEVLARPTLAAIEGMPSEFFSGTNLSAGLVSTSQQGGTTIVPLDKRFGIKLSVTPNFLPQGRVQLKVEAQRTALNASSESSRVAYQIEIGETTANANVVMNLGDTLVLSGLSEKSSSRTRDGVPGLQNVPGLQYLFSNKRTNDLQRSVLILVTPRAPVQVAEGSPADNDPMGVRMKRLRGKFGIPDKTPANIEAVLTQMDGNDFYREFRQGDVTLERWDRMRTTGDRLKEALGFLYY